MTPTFPAALVEQVARAMCVLGDPGYISDMLRERATAALSALPAAVQAVARGEAVAVPVSVRRHAVAALITEGHKTLAAELAGAASYLPEWAQEPQR